MGQTLQPDDRLSHYRIVGPLGTGGMGEVYSARDQKLDRSVAIKVLPPRLVRDEERVRRFVREAKSASGLNHPNIVTIYEIGHDEVRTLPVHFISMELVSGDTLTEKIHEKQEDLRTLVGHVAQAADGIAKAHAAGIVHRDLKPGNIMISEDGFAKVLDFGLAKLVERDTGSSGTATTAPTAEPGTGQGQMLGTVGYMSPEQVQTKPTDHRSDIFSIGCILYECATRRRPFAADTDIEVMHRILRDPPTPVEDYNPGVPAELRRVIRRCLAKNPDQRFQSMKDLAIDLREMVDNWDELPVGGSSQIAKAPLAPSRSWKPAVIAAGVLVVLAAVAIGLYATRQRGAAQAQTASGELHISTLMSRDDLGEAKLSGDGRYLAFVAGEGDRTSLNVRQVRTGSDVQILPPQDIAVHGITFSPDGDYLYFLNLDSKLPNYNALFQVASLGGTPRKVAFDVDSSPTFSPDGKRICFRRGEPMNRADTLILHDLETGKEHNLVRVQDPEQFRSPDNDGTPSWSPDGRSIVVPIFTAAGGAHTKLAIIDAESGQRRELPNAWLFVNGLAWLPDGTALIVSAVDLLQQRSQIYRVALPGGAVTRITSDFNGYEGVSVSSTGMLVAATRRSGVGNVWGAPLESGKEPHPVTFATGSATSVEFLATLPGGAVAFTAPQGDHTYLWRCEADGSGRRQLTTQGVYVINVDYADRSGIVFTQVEENAVLHVWRMDANGGGLRQITDGTGEQFSTLASDGSVLLFWQLGDQAKAWALDPLSGEPRVLLQRAVFGTADISDDASRVLYVSSEERDGNLYPVHHVASMSDGSKIVDVILPPGASQARLTPKGDAITYIDRETGFNLMQRPLDRDRAEQLTHFQDGGRTNNHAWSPDGRLVLLHRHVGSADNLWVFDPRSGKPPTPLTSFKSGTIEQSNWALDSKSVVMNYGAHSVDVVLISGFR